jgi:hypothetical protein
VKASEYIEVLMSKFGGFHGLCLIPAGIFQESLDSFLIFSIF